MSNYVLIRSLKILKFSRWSWGGQNQRDFYNTKRFSVKSKTTCDKINEFNWDKGAIYKLSPHKEWEGSSTKSWHMRARERGVLPNVDVHFLPTRIFIKNHIKCYWKLTQSIKFFPYFLISYFCNIILIYFQKINETNYSSFSSY